MEYIINDDYMTSKEAATILNVTRGYIWRLVQAGRLAGVVYERRLYVTRASVAACDLAALRQRGRPSNEQKIAIGKRCREARKASGLRFGEAAKQLGMYESELSLKERGLCSMTTAEISAQAILYGVSVKSLEFGE